MPITFTLDQKSCAETLLGSKANPRKANPKHPIASKKKRSRSDNQGCRIARNVHNVGNDFIAEVMGVRRTRNARSEDMGSAPGNTLSFYVASGAAKSSESGKTKKVVSETCECVCLRKGYLCYEAGRCARDAERKTRHDAHNGSPNVFCPCVASGCDQSSFLVSVSSVVVPYP